MLLLQLITNFLRKPSADKHSSSSTAATSHGTRKSKDKQQVKLSGAIISVRAALIADLSGCLRSFNVTLCSVVYEKSFDTEHTPDHYLFRVCAVSLIMDTLTICLRKVISIVAAVASDKAALDNNIYDGLATINPIFQSL